MNLLTLPLRVVGELYQIVRSGRSIALIEDLGGQAIRADGGANVAESAEALSGVSLEI